MRALAARLPCETLRLVALLSLRPAGALYLRAAAPTAAPTAASAAASAPFRAGPAMLSPGVAVAAVEAAGEAAAVAALLEALDESEALPAPALRAALVALRRLKPTPSAALPRLLSFLRLGSSDGAALGLGFSEKLFDRSSPTHK